MKNGNIERIVEGKWRSRKIRVFWNVKLCNLVDGHTGFEATCCLHHHGTLVYHTTVRTNKHLSPKTDSKLRNQHPQVRWFLEPTDRLFRHIYKFPQCLWCSKELLEPRLIFLQPFQRICAACNLNVDTFTESVWPRKAKKHQTEHKHLTDHGVVQSGIYFLTFRMDMLLSWSGKIYRHIYTQTPLQKTVCMVYTYREIVAASFKNHVKQIHSVRKTRVMNVKVCGTFHVHGSVHKVK
jgi:hypothetical protein